MAVIAKSIYHASILLITAFKKALSTMTTKTTMRYCVAAITLLGTLPQLAFGQAGIVSEREKIVSYSAEDLNPTQPGYEWEGVTLLQDFRVIDGLGNRPQTGQDLLVADGKIQAVGKSGSLDVPADAKIIHARIDGCTYPPFDRDVVHDTNN